MLKDLKSLSKDLGGYCQKQLGFKNPPKLFFKQDLENSKSPFGKTAFYNPQDKSVTLFTSGRHVKDILRSLAHEFVHHQQNLRGDLTPEKCGEMTLTYAQDNQHMRNMEKEAYLIGNMMFRDWEDSCKCKNLSEFKILKENKKMGKSVKISKKVLKELITTVLKNKLKEASSIASGNVEGSAANISAPKKPSVNAGGEDEIKEVEEVEEATTHQDVVDAADDAVDATNKAAAKEKNKEVTKDPDAKYDDDLFDASEAEEDEEEETMKESKIQTPEQENSLFERRFGSRNQNLFQKLTKKWTR